MGTGAWICKDPLVITLYNKGLPILEKSNIEEGTEQKLLIFTKPPPNISTTNQKKL